MAKKRLNKKVAIIGSAVFVFFVFALIGVVLYLSRSPEGFIKDGDVALRAAREAKDEEVRVEEYGKAERNYHKARSLAKTDSLKVEMLFKLADLYIEIDRWRNVRGCWNKIIQIYPKNIKARLGRLKYIYIIADSGSGRIWSDVASQASEFIEVVDANLFVEDTAQWESFEVRGRGERAELLGAYLYLLRGRAAFELTKQGAVTDPDELLARAIDDLKKVQELQPDNIDAYWYLAQAIITKGEILALRGDFAKRDEAAEQAEGILRQAIEVVGTNPQTHINLLKLKLKIAKSYDVGRAREQIQLLEPEYLSLVKEFDSSAEAFSALAEFYRLYPENLDKAINAAERAMELDERDVYYAIHVVDLYYRKFSIYGPKTYLYKAIEIARNALTLPDAQEVTGPQQRVNSLNRIKLHTFLANCYIEQILEPCEIRTESENQEWIEYAEGAVHEIEQFFGSGENLEVVKWQGMLELARAKFGRGDKNVAIRRLYAIYEQLKASEDRDARLSYTLAKLFENTSEIGAAAEFFTSALNAGITRTKPEVYLDRAGILLKLGMWTAAMSDISMFEKAFGPSERSRALRIKAHITAGQLDKAEAELVSIRSDDPNAIKLNLALIKAKIEWIQKAMTRKRIQKGLKVFQREKTPESVKIREESQITDELMIAELKGYTDTSVELAVKLLPVEPNSIKMTLIAAICETYIKEGETNKAIALIDQFLEYFPDNVTILFYKRLLSEPEPAKVSQERRSEIKKEVLSSIDDPIRRAVNLGLFYRGNDEPNEAAEEFEKVLKIGTRLDSEVEESAFDQAGETTGLQRLAAGHLFEIALGKKDWEQAEQVGDVARYKNFDDCEGTFFSARLALVKEDYESALAMVNECLKQRPVFSHGFLLRSNVYAALGNAHASIEDAQRAAFLNPIDGDIVKALAFTLYQRNRRLGDNVPSQSSRFL